MSSVAGTVLRHLDANGQKQALDGDPIIEVEEFGNGN